MRIWLKLLGAILILISTLGACDPGSEDVVPDSYFMIQLNPDDVYMYNGGDTEVRLDPLLNDSIKVSVSVSYSEPLFGRVSFVQNEGWFYKPNAGFFGVDHITYTVCHQHECWTSNITMHVERPINPATCQFQINGESVETQKNTPIAIRIFDNDFVCSYLGGSVFAPERGTFYAYSYSGSFKNMVYVYYPPANFTGVDRFKYRLFTPDGGFLEASCTVSVK